MGFSDSLQKYSHIKIGLHHQAQLPGKMGSMISNNSLRQIPITRLQSKNTPPKKPKGSQKMLRCRRTNVPIIRCRCNAISGRDPQRASLSRIDFHIHSRQSGGLTQPQKCQGLCLPDLACLQLLSNPPLSPSTSGCSLLISEILSPLASSSTKLFLGCCRIDDSETPLMQHSVLPRYVKRRNRISYSLRTAIHTA